MRSQYRREQVENGVRWVLGVIGGVLLLALVIWLAVEFYVWRVQWAVNQ